MSFPPKSGAGPRRRIARGAAVLGLLIGVAGATDAASAGLPAGAVSEPVAPAGIAATEPPEPAGIAELDGAHARVVRYGLPLVGEPVVLRRFDPPDQPWLAGHRGADLAAGDGDPVLAAGDGVVAFAGSVAGTPVVSIDHADGIRTTYQPVTAGVEVGQGTRVGEPIGTLAEAPIGGEASGHCGLDPCLHWGARTGQDHYLDPLALLRPPVIRLYPVD